MQDSKTLSPMMKQYFALKEQYPEVMLLIRVGDFYETFGEDALIASRVLGIVLTKRASGGGEKLPLAGVPHHALQAYLPKLVRAGYKVAVVDQMEDPKLAKGLVKREITELITPGVAIDDNMLEEKENNYLAALTYDFKKDICGAAFLDVSTGSFFVAQGNWDYIQTLLAGFKVKEIVVDSDQKNFYRPRLSRYFLSFLDEWAFSYESSIERLKRQLKASSLKGYGIYGSPLGICSAGAILVYLEQTCHPGISHINSIGRIDSRDFLWMDLFTMRNLEIFASASGGKSLVDVMDSCCSPMGSRLLRTWLQMPSVDVDEIGHRQDSVEFFVSQSELLDTIREKLSLLGDMERILSRAAAGRISPRECLQLRRSLTLACEIRSCLDDALKNTGEEAASLLSSLLTDCSELASYMRAHIKEDTAVSVDKGDVIAEGVDEELDALRALAHGSRSALDDILQREIAATGIASLKIDYNSVFGYYLEVRNMYRDRVPENWTRKQTLVNAERYVTEELKEYERKIMSADATILAIQTRIYAEVVAQIQQSIADIKRNSAALSRIDVLCSFARNAIDYDYCRPLVDSSSSLEITGGRHAVIERSIPTGQEYVPNDVLLDNSKNQIIILTGPNMAGKSALLRQTALIVLMAQTGSYVPASSARIGYCDALFTRVGASDNISQGESTFMVEMTESAMILNNLTSRSLVLLDEIGRGTSTYDGMSIARAIVEYIHENPKRAKTLFATHYHELNDMEDIFPRIHNFHIAVQEDGKNVIFLRKLRPGGVAHSFGIHVARMAGMPAKVIESAERTLAFLEKDRTGVIPTSSPRDLTEGTLYPDGSLQLSMFQLDDPLLEDLRSTLQAVDINNLTPLQAFDLLRSLVEKLGLSN